MLANILKPLLRDLISPMQNAFVARRQIHDNIWIAHKLFHFLKLRKIKCKFEHGIKLDMHKFMFRVEWDFLEAVMKKWGLILRGGVCQHWKFCCYPQRAAREKVCSLEKPSSRGRSIPTLISHRQWGFVSDIQKIIDGKQLKSVQMKPYDPIISHIFLADSTLLFLKADRKNCSNLVQLL